MRYVDTHCHLDFNQFDECRREILGRCKAFGVVKLLVPSVGAVNWEKVLRLAQSLPEVEAAIGIHPCFLKNADVSFLDDLESLVALNRRKLIAVGEIGLDRFADTKLEEQYVFFKRQLVMAVDYDLAVMVHSRRMNDEVVAGFKQFNIKRGVVHGFSGSLQQAKNIWALGVRLGIGGVITYQRAIKTRKALAAMPLQSLLLETDAPDMRLCGFQGQANSPERIPLIFDALCKLRSENSEAIAEQLYENTRETFRIEM